MAFEASDYVIVDVSEISAGKDRDRLLIEYFHKSLLQSIFSHIHFPVRLLR